MPVWLRSMGGFALILALTCVHAASAQDLKGDRVRAALDATDHRIERAAALVGSGANAQARGELGLAVELQGRARGSLSANAFAVAVRQTLAARDHADRAVAIVRGLPDPDRVSQQVERTREILDRAEDRLSACDLPRARAMLRVAVQVQARAEQAVSDSRFLGALQLTLAARERADRALRLCNVAESLQDSATRAVQRTDEVIARARAATGSAPADEARALLARATSLQGEGQAELRAGRWEAALRLTQGARMLARRALRLSFGEPTRR